LSALLFILGLLRVIMRRNLLIIYMSLELMLNAANLALVAFSRFKNQLDGQVMVFFIITVAAAEVSVGLALIVALYRKRQTAHVEDLTSLKLSGVNLGPLMNTNGHGFAFLGRQVGQSAKAVTSHRTPNRLGA